MSGDVREDCATGPAVVACLRDVTLEYGDTRALNGITLAIPAGQIVGVIGPDGVGKSSLFALIAGARAIQGGSVEVLGGDMANARHRNAICPRIAYMPQGLGRNLYPTLSVYENLDFFARLFGHGRDERERRMEQLLSATGMAAFRDRPVGKLSGGMKQKLGLCCALIHDPDLLILDEPTTGVDPLSRRQFWRLIARIRAGRPGMSVLVATAYMDEAAGFDHLVAMHDGQVLQSGTPRALLEQTQARSLEQAFIRLLPGNNEAAGTPADITPRAATDDAPVAIEARGLTRRFGDFTAVDNVSFRIRRGEIFGFIGSNGCGKTTTMKILTGLLPASDGEAWLFGHPVDPHDIATRRRVGYMTQSFSLYSELTVRQNLALHARLFGLPADGIPARVQAMAGRFGLEAIMDALPDALPLGERQRLSLAVAMIHGPEILILDEPTSGVDPVARENFWRIMIDLARRDNVTIFISTHFMNEAERCDRVSLMHAGKVLATDTPAAIAQARGAESLEEAFIGYLEAEAGTQAEPDEAGAATTPTPKPGAQDEAPQVNRSAFSLRRLFSYTRREALELLRDPIRLTMAALGSGLLMIVLGYGISMDVEDLTFAVLDLDQTTASRDYTLNLSGSRYFLEQPPIESHEDMDRRLRAGEIGLAIEIPGGFARDLARGDGAQISAWIDGSMPSRAETVRGYVQGMHQHWLAGKAREAYGDAVGSGLVSVETRFRYNPEVSSLPAMVPAVIPLLLILIPAILAALAVVREKELGSIVNLYVTPVTRLEFLLGKQIPYLVLGMLSYALLTVLAIYGFGVPVSGSLATLTAAAFIYVMAATAFGLLVSTFVRSQIAALFGTALLTMLPAVTFSGLLNPVTSMEGSARFIGDIFPTTHFITIARGTFSKALGFHDLQDAFLPLLIAVPVLIGLAAALLRKQER